jgi:glycosyltransferase involved in cell wall biosynthesis
MKIGLVIYGSLDSLSGGYLYDRKLMDYLKKQGDGIEIISLPIGSYARHLVDNFSFRNPMSSSKANKKTKSSSKALDVLIQDELNHPSLLAANADFHSYPIISLVHHLRSLEQRPAWQNTVYQIIEQKYLRSVNGFIFNSNSTRRAVHALLRHQVPYVVANPPTDRLGLQVSGQQIIERGQAPVLRVLFLGNVIHRKGLHTLLEAIRLLPTPVHLDVVGALGVESGYSRQMQKTASSLGAGFPVRFHGPLDNEPLITLMQQAHVLAIPSSYEGFGIAYLEGMGFGLPAIGTTQGAASEIISDGIDGFIVPPDHPRALAERLRSLSRDRQLLIRMGLAARDRFIRQPAWDSTAASIREFLQSLIQGNTRH